jgi:C1A family cysteine protease
MPVHAVVDLRSQFAEVRHQGSRSTCMAFAASDSHAFARGKRDLLSVEYAFFHAVQRKPVPDPSTGIAFSHISAAIEIDGQPLEHGWPYTSASVSADRWKPPKDPGELFRRRSSTVTLGINMICTTLDAGRPMMMILDVSQAFYSAIAGGIISPVHEPRINTHAVIAVGHGTANGARCILIRNSWGTGWADHGYAWTHEQYLKPRLLVLGVMN